MLDQCVGAMHQHFFDEVWLVHHAAPERPETKTADIAVLSHHTL